MFDNDRLSGYKSPKRLPFMKILSLIVSFLCLAASALAETPPANPPVDPMKTLNIRWQRLVSKGETCPRCGATEKEVEKALQTLEQSLAPLGVKVALEKQELNQREFQKDPLQSNRLWIEGRSLEEWLGLKVGQTPCCQTCGDAECRTLETAGQVYEFVPAELIIKAGLLAAAKLVGPQTSEADIQKNADAKRNPQPCCPQ
jgi:hypothetical protein